MQVIGAGLPRTGTSSLKAALERLGFGPCYHMFELMQNPEHVERWRPVLSGEPARWDQVFDGYQSAVDFPASMYWRELADAYPQAKIILTVRDPHRWHASTQNAFTPPPGVDMTDFPAPLRDLGSIMPLLRDEAKKILGSQWEFAEAMDEEYAVEAFTQHTARVRDALPSDRLLVFEASQGWGPLCEFLGVEVPTDEPFPHLNDSKTMQDMFTTMEESETLVTPFNTNH